MNQATFHHSPKSPRRWLPQVVAVLMFGASFASHAGGGEALDIELPSMRTPVESTSTGAAALTRAEVREALQNARMAGIATPSGEIGDTTEVLANREQFYALQNEVRETGYTAAAQREAEAQALGSGPMIEMAPETVWVEIVSDAGLAGTQVVVMLVEVDRD